MALKKVREIVPSFPVVVFSKTYCGYCRMAKQLLSQLGARYRVIELEEERDGDEVQSALAKWTGQRTVPNVFHRWKTPWWMRLQAHLFASSLRINFVLVKT